MKKKKRPIKRKSKYNYPQLKKEFFASPIEELKGFFEDKYGTYNGRIRQKTAGWSEEKKKFKMEIAEKSIAKVQDEEIEENAKALRNLLMGIRMKVSSKAALEGLSVKDLQRLFDMLMPLNGKPTKYVKSETINRNLNSEAPLTLEEEEELREALKDVGLERDRK